MDSLIRSLDAHKYLRAKMMADSWQAGWRSLLLRTYVDPAIAEEFTTPPTGDHLIVLVKAGGCEIESCYGGAWHKARYDVGSLGMTAPGDEAKIRWRGETPTETLQLHLPSGIMREAAGELTPGDPLRLTVPSRLISTDPVIEAMIRGLADAVMAGAPDLYAETAAGFLAMHLLLHHGSLPPPRPPQRDDKRLRRAEEYMRANLAAPLSLDALAREAGLSRFHFLRLFKRARGETPLRHLTRMRMEEAKQRLRLTDDSITEVAFACGYDNAAHFAATFRRQVGISPSAYRRSA